MSHLLYLRAAVKSACAQSMTVVASKHVYLEDCFQLWE